MQTNRCIKYVVLFLPIVVLVGILHHFLRRPRLLPCSLKVGNQPYPPVYNGSIYEDVHRIFARGRWEHNRWLEDGETSSHPELDAVSACEQLTARNISDIVFLGDSRTRGTAKEVYDFFNPKEKSWEVDTVAEDTPPKYRKICNDHKLRYERDECSEYLIQNRTICGGKINLVNHQSWYLTEPAHVDSLHRAMNYVSRVSRGILIWNLGIHDTVKRDLTPEIYRDALDCLLQHNDKTYRSPRARLLWMDVEPICHEHFVSAEKTLERNLLIERLNLVSQQIFRRRGIPVIEDSVLLSRLRCQDAKDGLHYTGPSLRQKVVVILKAILKSFFE